MVALYNDTKKVILLIGTSVRTSCPKLSFLAASFALPYPTNPLPTHCSQATRIQDINRLAPYGFDSTLELK